MTDAPRSLVERLHEDAAYLEGEKWINGALRPTAVNVREAATALEALEREVAGLTAQLKTSGEMLEPLRARMNNAIAALSHADRVIKVAREQVREQAAKAAEAAEAAFAAHVETAWRFSLDGLTLADIISAAASAASIAAAIRAMPLEDSTFQPPPKPET